VNEALHRHPSQSARNHAATYARADLVAGTVLWLVALAAVVLIFSKKSNAYYRREPAQR